LLAELLVVYGREGLATASALLLNVSVSNSSVERFQLRQELSASLQELALPAQLVQALPAITEPIVQPAKRVAQLSLDTAKRAC
jgi:hypothetical protein